MLVIELVNVETYKIIKILPMRSNKLQINKFKSSMAYLFIFLSLDNNSGNIFSTFLIIIQSVFRWIQFPPRTPILKRQS